MVKIEILGQTGNKKETAWTNHIIILNHMDHPRRIKP